MFHQVTTHDPLRTTKNKSNAPAWLNPERIASIIAHLEDSEKTKDDMHKCITVRLTS
jgi:hypothetical protein